MRRPRILVTTWRQKLKTFLDPETDLYTLAPDYPDAVARAGGIPLMVPHLDAEEISDVLADVDGLLLTGGFDMDPTGYAAENTSSWFVDPAADHADRALVRAAVDAGTPVLGVCRGAQVVNVALGGDLRQEVQESGSELHPTYQEMPDMEGHRHPVALVAGSRLAELYGGTELVVNSLHHQAVGRLAEGLRIGATAPDGTVEAIEGEAVLAVQWHPEMIPDEGGDVLFADLVRRAGGE